VAAGRKPLPGDAPGQGPPSRGPTYSNLDLVSHTDRQARTWTYAHDANRRLTSVTDPAGAQTQFGYNNAGKLTSLTDPKSNVTQWTYDIEGRLSGKQYADTSTVTYINAVSSVCAVGGSFWNRDRELSGSRLGDAIFDNVVIPFLFGEDVLGQVNASRQIRRTRCDADVVATLAIPEQR
jgi:YD repeat-containing protein